MPKIFSIALLMLLVFADLACAHPLNIGYLKVATGSDGLQVTLQMNPLAAEKISGLQGKKLVAGSEEYSELIFSHTLGSAPWDLNSARCLWKDSRVVTTESQQGPQVEISALANCQGAGGETRTLLLRLPFLKKSGPSYSVIGRMNTNGSEQTFLADPQHSELELSISAPPRFTDFVHLGMEHIGAVPGQWHGAEGWHLPDGIDHILFVLALVMGGLGAKNLVKTISGFTLGHSVTLALATLGLAHLPTRIVEVGIALSIVFVAVQALRMRPAKHQWRIAALFGLFHGFGFASALSELALNRENLLPAIVGFNVGVELGQLVIIGLVLPLLYFLKSQAPNQYKISLQMGAASIALAGSYWAILRTGIFS
jgi:hypothetical protein